MPKWIGNRFGSVVPIGPGSSAGSAIYSLFDQYYASREDGWASTGASGGNIDAVPGGDGYNYHVFTSSGSLVAPGNITNCELLVVGPGGGGSQGNGGSGGGGAGGVVHVTGHTLVSGTYTITIPAGGVGGPESSGSSPVPGIRGGNLTMEHSSTPTFQVIALGGGGGSAWGSTSPADNPAPNRNGGSGGGIGGGGGDGSGTGDQPGQPLTVPTGTVNRYGNRGGNTGVSYRGGGGGGAGGVGDNGTPGSNGGEGGNGQPFTGFVGPNPAFGPMPSDWKTAVGPTGLYGGGGGAGSENGGTTSPAPGGTGGGGPSGSGPNSAPADDNRGNPAVANTGGGGGAGWWDPGLAANGGNGGIGIVLVRYPT
jgi:hypothetical protein